MECDRIKELMSPFLDGELDERDETNVREHIDACAGCREEMAALRRVSTLYRNMSDPEPPSDFNDRVYAAIGRMKLGRRRFRLFSAPVLAAAATIALLAGAALVMKQTHMADKGESVMLAEAPEEATSVVVAARRARGEAELGIGKEPFVRQRMGKEETSSIDREFAPPAPAAEAPVMAGGGGGFGLGAEFGRGDVRVQVSPERLGRAERSSVEMPLASAAKSIESRAKSARIDVPVAYDGPIRVGMSFPSAQMDIKLETVEFAKTSRTDTRITLTFSAGRLASGAERISGELILIAAGGETNKRIPVIVDLNAGKWTLEEKDGRKTKTVRIDGVKAAGAERFSFIWSRATRYAADEPLASVVLNAADPGE